jgi:hypothetical protein
MIDEALQVIAEESAGILDSAGFNAVDPQQSGHHEYFIAPGRYGWYFQRNGEWFRAEFTRVTDSDLRAELSELIA